MLGKETIGLKLRIEVCEYGAFSLQGFLAKVFWLVDKYAFRLQRHHFPWFLRTLIEDLSQPDQKHGCTYRNLDFFLNNHERSYHYWCEGTPNLARFVTLPVVFGFAKQHGECLDLVSWELVVVTACWELAELVCEAGPVEFCGVLTGSMHLWKAQIYYIQINEK